MQYEDNNLYSAVTKMLIENALNNNCRMSYLVLNGFFFNDLRVFAC